jgi:hypothetical protein
MIKAVLVGGSNSLIRSGYVGATVDSCARRGIDFKIIGDLPVGASTILFGLFNLKQSAAVADADILIIEYGLNDVSIYGEDRKLLQHWGRAYEGAIRYAKSINPKIRILSVILEGKVPNRLRKLNYVTAGIHYLSHVYDLGIADVGRYLREVFGANAAHTSLYRDTNHYSSPVVTTMIGDFIGGKIEKLLKEAPVQRGLPPAVDETNLENAGIVTIADIPGEDVRYENSRVQVDARNLAGRRVSFDLEGGKLLAVFYVCDLQSSRLYLQKNDQTYAADMMRVGVREGKFRFLLAMLGCEFLHGLTLMRDEDTSSYTISGSPISGQERPISTRNSTRHDDLDEIHMPVVGALFTGRLSNLYVV